MRVLCPDARRTQGGGQAPSGCCSSTCHVFPNLTKVLLSPCHRRESRLGAPALRVGPAQVGERRFPPGAARRRVGGEGQVGDKAGRAGPSDGVPRKGPQGAAGARREPSSGGPSLRSAGRVGVLGRLRRRVLPGAPGRESPRAGPAAAHSSAGPASGAGLAGRGARPQVTPRGRGAGAAGEREGRGRSAPASRQPPAVLDGRGVASGGAGPPVGAGPGPEGAGPGAGGAALKRRRAGRGASPAPPPPPP